MQLLKSMTTLKTITKKKCFKVLFKNRYALRLFAYLRDIVLWLNSQWKLGDCCIWKINGKACRWIKFEAAKCPQFFPFFLLFLQRQNRFETKRARSTRGLGWGLRAKRARRILRWHPVLMWLVTARSTIEYKYEKIEGYEQPTTKSKQIPTVHAI